MERILLVEPNYKNKYPPIGLMKISTYYKSKGDFVQYHKGILPAMDVQSFDKIFITTLFTFDFDMCVETIRYYTIVAGHQKVFVGGIAATIMPERFEREVPGIQLLRGQLVSSNMIGYDDDVNIDILALDYDILWDIPYDYPAADSYFIYTSRGCPRHCSFCAVRILEPTFYECENVRGQIERVDERFGMKKSLLIMDNNALYSPNLASTVDILVALGFGASNNRVKKSSEIPVMLRSLSERLAIGKAYDHLLQRIKKQFLDIKVSRISREDAEMLQPIYQCIEDGSISQFVSCLLERREPIEEFFEKYTFHTIKRYVDFNQGLDARFFTDEKAKVLAKLAIKPCRIAFDNINQKDTYFDAITLAAKNGIQHFSNYLLYNYEDTPADLWERLYLNIRYCETHPEIKSLFSFPMKYASIEHTDRDFIGKNWNKKYLKSLNVILNVTRGVVAKEKDFFLRAFGHDPGEFTEILSMPDDYIRYRDYFEKNGLIQCWKDVYRTLDAGEKADLVKLLSDTDSETHIMQQPHQMQLDRILKFYTAKKSKIENNEAYYFRLLKP